MRKKIIYILILLCAGIYGSAKAILEISDQNTGFKIDSYLLPAYEISDPCISPTAYGFKKVKDNQVTLYWTDNTNTAWEYYVMPAGGPMPAGTGISTTTDENIVTHDNSGNPLQPLTEYEYYVRSVCENGSVGVWEGPINFETLCSMASLPFTETFNTSSATFNCWTIIDVNNDADISAGEKIWKSDKNTYEGNGAMFFDSGVNFDHDDWLISPTLRFNSGKMYALTFYYKTSFLDPSLASFHENQFEVVLSTQGIDLDSFTTQLLPMQIYTNTTYQKRLIIIDDIDGEVNIAWHIKSELLTQVYVDFITVEEIDCIPPDDNVNLDNITENSASFNWEDSNNTSWEYYVQPFNGGTPAGSGTMSNVKEVTVTKTSGTGGANLQPNTDYEFYVRANCGTNKFSPWVGPIYFKTRCVVQPLPFWEGFNTDSTTFECWTIRDLDKKPVYMRGIFTTNIWSLIKSVFVLFPTNPIEYEGDQAICFAPDEGTHDDWLISPTFNLDPAKHYRLKYNTKVFLTAGTGIKYSVLLSKGGISSDDFDHLIHSRTLTSTLWIEESAIVTGIGGDVSLAWHIESDKGLNNMILDNVFFEEVSCPEPFNIEVKEVGEHAATLFWDDEVGTKWEYAVQKKGTYGVPKSGNVILQKEVNLTADKNGNQLEPNTEYVFYIRSNCSNGENSDWVEYRFRTACGVFTTPFWEGFNSYSDTFSCWTVLDVNGDASSYPGTFAWGRYELGGYEGDRGMRFFNMNNPAKNDDWLISPPIKFDKDKVYRLKFHYVGAAGLPDNSLEVLASNSGTLPSDFTFKVLQSEVYDGGNYRQKKVFIDKLIGEVYLAWHIGDGQRNLHIDNVFVEEVLGCPEPLEVTLDDIGTDQVTVSWTDEMGANQWEYFIKKEDGSKPAGTGIKTTKKDNTIKQETNGSSLIPNTAYGFYVRTDCGNGEYSIWEGPYSFTTECDSYTPPFWEGFNTDSETINCWTGEDGKTWDIKDLSYGAIFEGNQSMFSGINTWLISPAFKLDGSKYILKYHYRTSNWGMGVETLLSTTGNSSIDNFTMNLKPMTLYDTGGYYEEEVLFIDGINAEVNIAWHANGFGVSLDNVILKKIETCPEPYNVKIDNPTTTSLEVSWDYVAGESTQWEVLVVYFGEDETASPVKKVTVTGISSTTVTGLPTGNMYTVYVRSKCMDGATWSDYSTPANGGTKVTNDECSSAITIPVNLGTECLQTVPFTLTGATVSSQPEPFCNQGGYLAKDVWFEFTATTAEKHMLKFLDRNYNGQIYGALYDVDCSLITGAALECFEPTNYMGGAIKNFIVFENLIPGKKYYIRLGVWDNPNLQQDFYYRLCITIPQPIKVSALDDEYTLDELVKDVFVKSNCDLVSNVRYQNGDGKPVSQAVNTIGYFNKGTSAFPFEEGIVLSSSEIDYLPGPYNGYYVYRGNTAKRWQGDKEINDAIDNIGGGPFQDKLVTQLEFDFTPVKDSLQFEYLFASNNYYPGSALNCEAASLFVVLLTDQITGEQQNIAMIPDTDTPIGTNTIRDAEKSRVSCNSINPEYYWKHYDFILREPLDDATESPIDIVGYTVPMKSRKTYVKPGRKYRIKMALVEFSLFSDRINSAVFFNAGSFDLGSLDLGADLLIENNTALCQGDDITLKSGFVFSDELQSEVTWYKDGVVIAGANSPDLEVTESGEYKVEVNFVELNCGYSDSVKVEFYPLISEAVSNPETIYVCRSSLQDILVNLTLIEADMFSNIDTKIYTTAYFKTEEDAESVKNALADATNYSLGKEIQNQNLYIRVENTETGCYEVFELHIQSQQGAVPDQPENVSVCAEYIFPETAGDQYYYAEPNGQGEEYKVGDVLAEPGEHSIYLLQVNSEQGCYEETVYQVNITAPVRADIFENKTLSCEYYMLKPLSEYNHYFTEPERQGNELYAGMQILQGQTVYVYARSEDGLCTDESSFTIDYEDCPIPRGISPNNDGLNDVFDLSPHGVESIKIYNRWGTEVYSHGKGYTTQWHGQNKSGKQLPDGTYYYVIHAHGKVRTGWVQVNK
ncbi:choice-of-anchor J domain-containing protein [Myroides indicus]|uniref:Cleaved adhesin domain-containing protein n=1 Tax=Myroides indicus TaxID=1323422 RepID=A0A4R7EMD3_9FLAO|nr:choice-of-anchor J domain-containing protein [Myroides indicus]TDS51431.1 cleaved adhesin domain-containing protein [Myroides indicus]